MKRIKTFKKLLMGILSFAVISINNSSMVFADSNSVGFTMSPMLEQIILNPGDSHQSSIRITNPGTQTADISYEVEVQSFYVDENYNNVFGQESSKNLIVDWITINSPTTGTLSPNETKEIIFTINVPDDAPAGGQYADIRVVSAESKTDEDGNMAMIGERIAIGHIIYAEIVGETVKQGDVIDADIPGFLLSGEISGSSSIKNTGNTHGIATYKLQVFPLFSDEEIYTNEEKPDQRIILPDRTFYNKIAWSNTPAMGIFNVVYTVEFEGVTTQVSKMVIKCPIWLLFIIIFAIIAIIIWLVLKSKKRREARR